MKKRIWALLLCLSLLLTMLSGCGKKQQAEDQAASGQQLNITAPEEDSLNQEPDVVGIAWQSDAELHPYTSTSVTNKEIISLLYEGLFLVTGNFET